MTPQEFDSFAIGWDLTEANYSTPGAGGGTFANLVSGQEAWTAGSTIPSFVTKSGTGWSLEGLSMAASVNDIVTGDMLVLHEFTVLVIGQVDVSVSSQYLFGGLNTAANTHGMYTNGGTARATTNGFVDTAIASAPTVNTTDPFVFVGSFSPMNDTIYAQTNGGTVYTDTTGAVNPGFMQYWTAAIGAMRTSYLDGWVARVLVFNRALHYRDNDNLQLLITSEMQKIGL